MEEGRARDPLGNDDEPRPASLSRVLSYEDAVSCARARFLADGTLDMQALVDELAVSRATLYRVVGNRDRLLGDVIWDLGARTLGRAIRETNDASAGVDRIIETSRRFNEYVVSFEPLRTFLRTEPLTAFRVLFSPAGRVHERAVAAWRSMLQEAADRGEIDLPFDVDRLAYVLVRSGESMLYADLIGGREPDIELAAMTQRAVLQLSSFPVR
ncbi:MAG: QsdR family transcriptional regulator [Actinomycetota bacterium]